MFTIPSPKSDEDESFDSLPELFLSQGSNNSDDQIVVNQDKSSSHFVPGFSNSPKVSYKETTKTIQQQNSLTITDNSSIIPKTKSLPQLTLPKIPAYPKKNLPPRSSSSTSTNLNIGTKSSQREILVHKRQTKNPVLKYIDNCRFKFTDEIVPDFVLSSTRCAIFISLVFHSENPGYLESRIRTIPNCFTHKLLITFVDRPDCAVPLQHISKLCIRHGIAMICAWSNLEAARYLETFKIYENKPADSIMGKVEEDYESRLTDCMTSIRTINKRDVKNLGTTYGSLKKIMNADMEELSLTEGLGAKKVADLYYTFHKPFKKNK